MTNLDILRRLVMISSENPGSDCRSIAGFIANFLRRHTRARLVLQPVRGGNLNLIVIYGRPRFFINAHLDTVPRANPGKAVLNLKKRRGQLYGLGTADVKGSIACQLAALTQTEPKNLLLLYSCNEEAGASTGVKTFLTSQLARGLKAGIVTEPTDLRIITQHTGIADFEICFKGRAAHAAYPHQGCNAILKAAASIMKIKSYADRIARCEYRGMRPTLNIGVIKGGLKSNIIPDQCTVRVNLRYLPGQTLKKYQCDLRRLVAGQSAALRLIFHAPPLTARAAVSAVVQPLRRAGAVAGNDSVNFWSEAALFTRARIPTVVFGPGSIKQAHAADEHIRELDLARGTVIYQNFFRKC